MNFVNLYKKIKALDEGLAGQHALYSFEINKLGQREGTGLAYMDYHDDEIPVHIEFDYTKGQSANLDPNSSTVGPASGADVQITRAVTQHGKDVLPYIEYDEDALLDAIYAHSEPYNESIYESQSQSSFVNLYKKIASFDKPLTESMQGQANYDLSECGSTPMQAEHPAQPNSVTMNVSMNGTGSDGIRDLMDILKNIEQTIDGNDSHVVVGEPTQVDFEPTNDYDEVEPEMDHHEFDSHMGKIEDEMMNMDMQPEAELEDSFDLETTEGVNSRSVNFDEHDLSRLTTIRNLDELKSAAIELISTPSNSPMKPEKIQFFATAINQKPSTAAVIKLMYDLFLSGEGHGVIGSKGTMKQNSYRDRFVDEEGDTESDYANRPDIQQQIVSAIIGTGTDLASNDGDTSQRKFDLPRAHGISESLVTRLRSHYNEIKQS